MAATRLPEILLHLQTWEPYPESLVIHEGRTFFLGRTGGNKVLGILTDERGTLPQGLAGTVEETAAGRLEILDTTHKRTLRAAALACAAPLG
jgi:hypothetical protein